MVAWDALERVKAVENGELVLFDLMYLCTIWVWPFIKLVKVERDYVFAWDGGASFSEELGNFPLTVTPSTIIFHSYYTYTSINKCDG